MQTGIGWLKTITNQIGHTQSLRNSRHPAEPGFLTSFWYKAIANLAWAWMVSGNSDSASLQVLLYINLPKWSEQVESSFDLFWKTDLKHNFVIVGKTCVINNCCNISPVFSQSYSNVYIISDQLQERIINTSQKIRIFKNYKNSLHSEH